MRPLTVDHLKEVLRLNIRCFRNGDNYTKHTFDYLLNEPRTLSYSVRTPSDELVGVRFCDGQAKTARPTSRRSASPRSIADAALPLLLLNTSKRP